MSARFLVLLLCVLTLFPGCASTLAAPTITIGAASSLQPLLDNIKPGFEKKTGIELRISYGASGAVARQIARGAPIDVFFSASNWFTDDLVQEGFLSESSVIPWAEGIIVVIRPVTRLSAPSLLTDAKRIAIANPRTAPYGAAAQRMLEFMNIWDVVEGRIIYAETASQALQFARAGEVDFAFVPASLLIAMSDGVEPVDEKTYGVPADVSLTQTVGLVSATPNLQEAVRFIEYFLAPDIASTVNRFGYRPIHGAIRGIASR